MSSLRPLDIRTIDDLVDFVRGPGYVLDFSDREFSHFFGSELDIDIDLPIYSVDGGSKGKRLRKFFELADDPTAARALEALWENREQILERTGEKDPIARSETRYRGLLEKLGRIQEAPTVPPPPQAQDPQKVSALKAQVVMLTQIPSHERGYAYEKFLVKLFDLYGLKPREPFRNKGEQIDGSFVLDGETYLFEAKWHTSPTGVSDLHTFEGKLSEKAAWVRGLFISHNGFSSDGLYAFGKAKRTICMTGLDLHDMLENAMTLDEAIRRKVRRAAENGFPHTPLRELL